VRVRLVTVALIALFVASACGTGTHTRIANYLDSVQREEQLTGGPLQQVSNANRDFARSKNSAKLDHELATSERTLHDLRQRLAALEAPPQATRLRALILQLVDREIGLAREVRQLAAVVPRYQAALRPVQQASAKLQTKLSATGKGAAAVKAIDAAKADELTAYAGTLESVLAAVRPLRPPPVWAPTYTQQVASLRELRSSALALAGAIRANDTAAIPPLLHDFDAAAVSNQSVAAQKRAIGAVTAYNARISALSRLARAVEHERKRLEQKYK
jgi:hypothetical protein